MVSVAVIAVSILYRGRMRHMKWITRFFVVCLSLFLFVGCGGAGHDGEVQAPDSSGSFKGKDFKDAVTQFESGGFTNVQTGK